MAALATLSAAMSDQFADITHWVFDLDNTLYPAECNLFLQVDRNIQQFIMDLFDLPPDEARKLQKSYFHEHGTTLNGLMAKHGIAPEEFLEYVHDIDVSPVPPNAALNAALAKLPGRKVIYTNGSVPHAQRVTDRLGVSHHFDGVFDIVAAEYVPKPEPAPYDILIEQFDIDPARAVMVEDLARNLKPAHERGMTTVWVRNDHHWSGGNEDDPHIHHVIDDLSDWLVAVTDRLAPSP